MNIAYLQLGSNVGDRLKLLSSAVNCIENEIGNVLTLSQIYQSTPWMVEGQENYLNQIIKIETKLSSEELLRDVLLIENNFAPKTITLNSVVFNTSKIFPLFINS